MIRMEFKIVSSRSDTNARFVAMRRSLKAVACPMSSHQQVVHLHHHSGPKPHEQVLELRVRATEILGTRHQFLCVRHILPGQASQYIQEPATVHATSPLH